MKEILLKIMLWLSYLMTEIFQTITHILSDVGFWKIFLPAIFGIIVWRLNEKSKRLHEEFIRKEERYINLLQALDGFTKDKNRPELRDKFLKELELAWLYCPDEIIVSVNNFLKELKSDESNQKNIRLAIKNIIVSIRKDLLSRKLVKKTKLEAKDYQLIAFEKEENEKT